MSLFRKSKSRVVPEMVLQRKDQDRKSVAMRMRHVIKAFHSATLLDA